MTIHTTIYTKKGCIFSLVAVYLSIYLSIPIYLSIYKQRTQDKVIHTSLLPQTRVHVCVCVCV
jgi:hypothetical protein